MVKYEGLQIQNESMVNADVVMFYDGKTTPIYCIDGFPLEIVRRFLQFKRPFEYECMSYTQYEELMNV